MEVKIKKLNSDAKIPMRGSDSAAGYDLFACRFEAGDGISLVIGPHETEKIHTGISLSIPEKYVGLIYARSGLATKQGLAPANKVGVIDADYRGEIIVALHNHTDEPQQIFYGDRIAQLVIAPFMDVEFIETDKLDDTNRGKGGFGSTGI